MERIDRLGWAAGLRFTAYGVRVGIRLTHHDLGLIRSIASIFPPGAKPSPDPRIDLLYSLRVPASHPKRLGLKRFNILYSGASALVKDLRLAPLLETLQTEMELAIAERASRRVFVHAAVAGWKGRAIVLPGSTFAGKTTLVLALARAGARFYSDEFAVIDEKGRVHPYPRPLSLRDSEGNAVGKVSAEELGLRTGRRPLPLGMIVSTRFGPSRRWRPRHLSSGQAVLELLAQAAPARLRPRRTIEILGRAVSPAQGLKGTRPEASETAARILDPNLW